VADDDLAARRRSMVDLQIHARGIRDPALLAAMREVPRHEFVAATLRHDAYEDTPLPIEETGWSLFRRLLAVASGERTCAERLGLNKALVLFNPAPVT